LFRTYGCEGIYVATASMEPTLPVDSHYFTDKLTYAFRAPRRGEVVMFDSPADSEKGLVKRVVGLPGEKIRIEDKHVFINGKELAEPYARYSRQDEILVGDNLEEKTIPEDVFFLMGDNRDVSPQFFVNRAEIQGRLMNVLE